MMQKDRSHRACPGRAKDWQLRRTSIPIFAPDPRIGRHQDRWRNSLMLEYGEFSHVRFAPQM
jgi:hypothetical protein